MLVKLLAGLALALALWALFRFAMGLRYSKVSREEARRAEEARGRRVVAEIPLHDDLQLFLEDAEGFYWGAAEARKSEIAGARMLLNGGIIASFARDGARLPEQPPAEEYDGRERWEVVIHLRNGDSRTVPCGTLREGVSREIARRVFGAVKGTA